ncbi:hypothetical protein MRX96_045923 [Rhipicephalus microplus]
MRRSIRCTYRRAPSGSISLFPGGTATMNYGGLGSSFARQFFRALAGRMVTAEGRCTSGDNGSFASFTAAFNERASCLVLVHDSGSILEGGGPGSLSRHRLCEQRSTACR